MEFRQYTQPDTQRVAIQMIENETKQSNILDVGCGTGELLYKLNYIGFERLSGCDVDESKYVLIDDKWCNSYNNVKYSIMDFDEGLQYQKDHFDIVFMLDVIEHSLNPYKLLNEDIYETLKPKGKLIVSFPNCENVYNRVYFMFKGGFMDYPYNDYAPKQSHTYPLLFEEFKAMTASQYKILDVRFNNSKVKGLPLYLPIKNKYLSGTYIIKLEKK